jgi:hypothetical protein
MVAVLHSAPVTAAPAALAAWLEQAGAAYAPEERTAIGDAVAYARTTYTDLCTGDEAVVHSAPRRLSPDWSSGHSGPRVGPPVLRIAPGSISEIGPRFSRGAERRRRCARRAIHATQENVDKDSRETQRNLRVAVGDGGRHPRRADQAPVRAPLR